MDPVTKAALIIQAIVLALIASAVIAFLYRAAQAMRGEPLVVEIPAIPERALIGRHRAPWDWPDWCLEGWAALAAAYPGSVTA